MFDSFFFLLRENGLKVSLTEWLDLMEALDRGLAASSLYNFYVLARAVLVKNEADFDRFDRSFRQYFGSIETPPEVADQVWEWLKKNDLFRDAPPDRPPWEAWNLEELRRRLLTRLATQDAAHHGGAHWIGTGGTSPFGHSGYNPAGIRLGGASHNRSAVKVAAQRAFRDFRRDETLGTRQFEVALRQLRRLSAHNEEQPEVLDLDETIETTGNNAGRLRLVWTRERKNTLKLVVLLDSGGSMNQYSTLVNRLFQAVNKSSHFKDLKFYYFHNCVYDDVFLEPMCRRNASLPVSRLLRLLTPDYRLLLVGDASMSPGELLMPYGALDWNAANKEPGLAWLKRLAGHFTHTAWLNPIPERGWENAEGAYTIELVGQVFPMFELTLEGMGGAVKKLKARSRS
ncbi:MAG: VWA domain-containing protein [Peptococcaceae bacterium]|jgi:uncharacterized protein with von Willebrand factor type A (vWA) domain|nr:VWA domain-containing protein [Peptococcaceae bacterium]